ncbi:MAG: iron-containing alcohol dehydrogenase [Bacteroidales bacterium]|jgi:alcohol dehydrogenase|nr:iron-containing alcohol dehydrogenase [Bacteroidales bacterium]
MNEFNYFIPTRILFGAGKLNELATVSLPGRKALVVISAGKSMRTNGYLERVLSLLEANGVKAVVFDRILSNPVLSHVTEGAALARDEQCDFVLGLGGGSAIDSAKSIALMAQNPGNYWDYIQAGTGKRRSVPNKALPVVAVTTTAGTGTEADPWTVITNEETHEKIGFGNADTFPALSIVDPELMLSVPPLFTAYQGFDALFHAAEGYISNAATPVSNLFALKSVELVTAGLPAAVRDGNNLEARTQVALANTLSGMVESLSSTTSQHAMEHALSALHPDLPHGAGLIMLSEAYFSFFADKIPHLLDDLARAMGEDTNRRQGGKHAFVDALLKLQRDCNVDHLKMSGYGICRDEIPALAQNAYDTMGKLFERDRYDLSFDETVTIIQNAYR